MIITIDGPAGTGKSTVAKLVAKHLKFLYFDTGAMYRAFTWYVLENQVHAEDEEAVCRLLSAFHLEIKRPTKIDRHYFVNGVDVTESIRKQEVNHAVSQVACYSAVRSKIVQIQKECAEHQNVVFEGRDMGTVVFPDANLKIYLDATPEIRAKRRFLELKNKFKDESFNEEKILQEIQKRDYLDANRKMSPLKKAKDAVFIDTSGLNIDQVVQKILQLLKHKLPKVKRPKGLYRFICNAFKFVFCLFYRVKVYGLEHFQPGGAIIAPNHASYLDPPLMAICCPEELHYLARASLFKLFFFGKLIRKLNAHPVTRESSDLRALKKIQDLIRKENKVLLFPEAYRTKEGGLQKLRSGIGFLAITTPCPVIPVYLHGTYEIWGPHHKIPRFSGKVSCVFGSPISIEHFKEYEKKQAMKLFTDRVAEKIRQLKKWHEQGAIGSPP